MHSEMDKNSNETIGLKFLNRQRQWNTQPEVKYFSEIFGL